MPIGQGPPLAPPHGPGTPPRTVTGPATLSSIPDLWYPFVLGTLDLQAGVTVTLPGTITRLVCTFAGNQISLNLSSTIPAYVPATGAGADIVLLDGAWDITIPPSTVLSFQSGANNYAGASLIGLAGRYADPNTAPYHFAGLHKTSI